MRAVERREPQAKTRLRERVCRVRPQRGTHFGYYPLVVGIWINIFLIFWGIGQTAQLNLMIATLVVAEIVRIGTQLYLYRRGH